MWMIILGIIIGLVLTIIGLFLKDICLFESIASGIILGVVSYNLWDFPSLLAIAAGFGALVVLYFLQNTAVGFWIVGVLFSVAWGFIVALIVFDATSRDMALTYIGWAVGALAFFGLHLIARRRQRTSPT